MLYYDPPQGEAQNNPLQPQNLQSGNFPGSTQWRIGGNENILIDGLNQRISVTTSTGSIALGTTANGNLALEVTNADGTKTGIGVIPGSTDLGFYTLDASGNVVQKIVGATRYIQDITNDKNVMQDGELPDGSYGWAVAKTGVDVEDIFS